MTINERVKLTALSVSHSNSRWIWQTFTQIGTWHRLYFSCPSVSRVCQSVIFITFIITISPMLATQTQTMTHQLLLDLRQSTHSRRDKLRGTMETVSCGATSGVFLRCSTWHGLVSVLTADRW